MTSPNPMALDAKALEAADPKLIRYIEMLRHQCAYNGPCADNGDGCTCSATELHRRSAAPPLATGEGLTPGDMAAFGASDAACTLFPGEWQAAERQAYMQGVADAVSTHGIPDYTGIEIHAAANKAMTARRGKNTAATPPKLGSTGCFDMNGKELFLGDRVVYHLEGPHTKPDYWNPEYEIVWRAPTFTLSHVGGGKDGDGHQFKLRNGGPNGDLELLKAGRWSTPALPPQAAGEGLAWPVGDVRVIWYDPDQFSLQKPVAGLELDWSLAIRDRAKIGDRFYSEAQVRDILASSTPAARAAVLPEPQLTDLDRQSIDELREYATGPLDTRLPAWLDKRAQPNSGIRYEGASFDLETGRAHQSRVELHAEDADFIVKHFHGRGAADLAAALRTRPATSTMDGWQTMDSAPSGKVVLLWKPATREIYVACRLSGEGGPGWCTPDGFEIFGAEARQYPPAPPATTPILPIAQQEDSKK